MQTTETSSPIDQRAFAAYERVREALVRMKGSPAAGPRDSSEPSAYWAQELSNIDFMLDASPIIIRKLRHHAFWITGLRAYDYRVQDDARQELFEERLRALAAIGGSDLLVPEPETLGGFGYRIDGGLHNLDTLKFFEVLVGMRKAGILDPLREAAGAGPAQAGPHVPHGPHVRVDVGAGRSRPGSEWPVICEIGGGWGGLAYQLKTLMPGATYVIVDLPELFLFSAVYLQALFPEARLVLWDGTRDATEWRAADFVFVPNTRAEVVAAMSPSVTINVASFQEMTTAQVDRYGRLAAAAGCPSIYSLNRERSRYNNELTTVTEALSPYYELQPITLLDTDYTKAMKKPSRKTDDRTSLSQSEDLSYRHLAGSLRHG